MPNYFSNNFLGFPVALIILGTNAKNSKFTTITTIEIKQINIYACEMLNLDIAQPDMNKKFQEITNNYQIMNKTNLANKNFTLYDNLLHDGCSFHVSNYINEHNKIIYAKIKRTKEAIYLVIDDYEHDKMLIQEKMMGTISKQHLITVSHELKNYFCGLITTLEDCNLNINDINYQNLSACVDLIKKNIKIYILYNKVCLDKIKFSSDKKVTQINFDEYLYQTLNKFTIIYKYKDIIIQIEDHVPFIIETQYSYFKHFIHTLLLYVYYKSARGNKIQFKIQRFTNNKLNLIITGNCSETPQNSYDNGIFDTCVDNIERLNHDSVKKSVITVPVLEYLLINIGEFINAEVILHNFDSNAYGSNVTINNESDSQSKGSKEIICIKLNKVSFNLDSTQIVDNDTNNLKDLQKNSNTNTILNKKTFPTTKNYLKMLQLNLDSPRNQQSSCKINENQKCKPMRNISRVKTTQIAKKKYVSLLKESAINCAPKKFNTQYEAMQLGLKSKSSVNQKKRLLFEAAVPKNKYLQTNLLLSYDRRNSYDKSKLTLSTGKHINKSFLSFKLNSPFFHTDAEFPSNHSSSIMKTPEHKSLFSHSNSNLGFSEIYDKDKPKNELPDYQETEMEDVNMNASSSIYTKINCIIKSENGANHDGDYLSFFLKPLKCDCSDIAVVDDEKIITKSLYNVIKSQGYLCDCFSDGKYVYEKIIQKTMCNCDKKFYKLILLDIYMLDWSGIKTCEKINELIQRHVISRGLNVIIISAHKESDLDIPRYDFIKGFYQKPVSKRAVINILNEFYHSGNINNKN
jgi:CheY-like chemotaxis protein